MLNALKALLEEMLLTFRMVNRLLRFMLWRFTVRPRGFGVRVQESQMGQVFNYRQNLLPVTVGTDQQRIVIAVNGVDQPEVLLPASATEFEFQAGPVGATVKRTIDYLDASGNDSANFEDEFVIVDGVPPEAPEGFGELVQVSEGVIPD